MSTSADKSVPDSLRHGGLLGNLGLIAGPLFGVIVFFLLPDSYTGVDGSIRELPEAARMVAAIASVMAVWWMTEAIPVYVTALLPLALFPITGVADIKVVAASYGSPIVYLFLGGFMIALAIERWGLHQRLALNVLAAVGTRPTVIIGAFMALSALLSMWVTNTATTIMLLPVAVSVIALLPNNDLADGKADSSFAICLLLGIAYAASIGGMGTIIGTAPNVFVVSFMKEQLGRDIGFLEWMRFGVPLVIVFVPIAWLLLTRFIYPQHGTDIAGAHQLLKEEREQLPPFSRGELLTLIIFLATAAAWVSRPLLNSLAFGEWQPLAGLTDSGIAIIGAVALFLCPVSLRRREFLMDWESTLKLPWGLLILFGGGLALAARLSDSGFSEYLASVAAGMEGLPFWFVVMFVTASVVFLTELTSNTATTATLVPVFLAVAMGLGMAPEMLIMPATFAASCAFMLPVATPPNAVVFGSGYVRVGQMTRAGFWLNLVAIIVISLGSWLIVLPALGLS